MNMFIKKLLISILLCLIILFISLFIISAYRLKSIGSAFIGHKANIHHLNKYYEETPHDPNKLKLYIKTRLGDNFKFFPDAWGKPGHILLYSKEPLIQSFVITYGDGSKSITTYWEQDEKINLNDNNMPGILDYPKDYGTSKLFWGTILILLSHFVIFVLGYKTFIVRNKSIAFQKTNANRDG